MAKLPSSKLGKGLQKMGKMPFPPAKGKAPVSGKKPMPAFFGKKK